MEKTFWQDKWQTGNTPWDSGTAHPLLSRLVALALEDGDLKHGAAFLEPGCGRAHNGAALSQMGFHVVSEDFCIEATEQAQSLYGAYENWQVRHADALAPGKPEEFDGILSRAILVAIDPKMRPAFVQTCRQRLKPGGLFMGIIISETARDGGPPFALSFDEAMQLFDGPFTLVCAEDHTEGAVDEVVRKETLMIWKKTNG